MSAQVDRLTKLTSQLVGDIGRLPGVTLDAAGEAQLVQLLTDAFEQVGHVALDSGWTSANLFEPGPPIRMGHGHADGRDTYPALCSCPGCTSDQLPDPSHNYTR